MTSCIPSLPLLPSVSPLNSIVLIPYGYDFNTEESSGAIKSKEALPERACLRFQNGGVCNGKNGSSSEAVPSRLKTRMLILKRALNQLDLNSTSVGSFIFFGAREPSEVKAHLHNSIFQGFFPCTYS